MSCVVYTKIGDEEAEQSSTLFSCLALETNLFGFMFVELQGVTYNLYQVVFIPFGPLAQIDHSD